MRFSEFNEDVKASWYTNPADSEAHMEKPAYQRAGKPEPITRPVPGTKPSINLADPKQAAAYNASINAEKSTAGKPAVWTNNRTGVTSSTPPGANQKPPVSKVDRVGSYSPGEPTMGSDIPNKTPSTTSTPKPSSTAYDTGYNIGKKVRAGIDAGVDAAKTGINTGIDAAKKGISSKLSKAPAGVDTSTRIEPTMGKEVPVNKPNVAAGVEAGAEAGAKAGAKSIGKKVLGRVIPGAGVALDAEEAYRRYQNGDRTGAVISALGAAGGLVPGFGPAISFGAAGVNAARDMMPDTPATSSNSVINKANAQAANKGMGGRGSQSPVKPPTTTKSAPVAPVPSTENPPNVNDQDGGAGVDVPEPNNTTPNTRNVAPATRSATSSTYKGTAGAQAIQQANADKIKNVNDIRAGDTIKVGGQDYTIKPGDTLDKIARNQQSSTTTAQSTTSTLPNTTTNEPEEKSDDQLSNVIPNDNMAEETKSLNRIKSLAGLK